MNPSEQETVKQLKDLYVEAKTEFGAFTRSGCAPEFSSLFIFLKLRVE